MANKKITDFPKVNILNDDTIVLINQSNTTQTVHVSTIANTVATKIATGNVTPTPGSTITTIPAYIPKPLDSSNNNGKVLTYQYSTQTWIASANQVSTPTGGTTTPVDLTGLIPKPLTASNGQVLTYNQSNTTWVASSLSALGSNLYIAKPISTPINGQALVYSNNAWGVSSLNFIQKPSATNGQFLYYTSNSWGVSSLPDYIVKPTNPGPNQVLCWNDSTKFWVASSIPVVPTNYITNPQGSNDTNDILYYNGASWENGQINDDIINRGTSFNKSSLAVTEVLEEFILLLGVSLSMELILRFFSCSR